MCMHAWFGAGYPTVQWEIKHRDENLVYITALTDDEKSWNFYVVPTDKVETKFLSITKSGKYEKYRDNWEILDY